MQQAVPDPIRISEHAINQDELDRNALEVVTTLHENGFDAYLVGGCVRDLLCGEKPKDFDVATDATPEQVKALFRRSRLVGRRFPIAHVRFGRHIIEVSTFRQGQLEHVETTDQGLIVKDHVYGSIAEDAFRRDFTINALYYDVREHEIIDYVGGLEDIADKQVQFIGVPAERIAEDPVRILRAIRFAAKLGFSLDPKLADLYEDAAERLEEIPGARLFDEFLKLFLSGYGGNVWLELRETPLARSLFPSCNPDNNLVLAAMRNTDQRIANDQPVTPGFLIAVLLWEDFDFRNKRDNEAGKPEVAYEVALDTLAIQQQHISVPRRFSIFAREVWQLQSRLEERNARFIKRTLGNKRFRAAFDFLVLRADYDDRLKTKAVWWDEIQELDGPAQEKLISDLPKKSGRRNRRRKQPPKDFNQY